jgi:branched-chain amino acid transport system substrate-binding protein
VLEESIAPTVNDLSPALLRAKNANADVIVLHLHAASTVLAVRQARQVLPNVPIVAGSAMHQPATAALLEPGELKGVCAETAASPISATSGPLRAFLDAYRAAYKSEPDAFAAAQFDAWALCPSIGSCAGPGSWSRPATRSTGKRHLSRCRDHLSFDGKGNMARGRDRLLTARTASQTARYAIPPALTATFGLRRCICVEFHDKEPDYAQPAFGRSGTRCRLPADAREFRSSDIYPFDYPTVQAAVQVDS